jgi:hypothetical protein
MNPPLNTREWLLAQLEKRAAALPAALVPTGEEIL